MEKAMFVRKCLAHQAKIIITCALGASLWSCSSGNKSAVVEGGDDLSAVSASLTATSSWSPQLASGLCLSTANGALANGTSVVISPCSNNAAQKWAYTGSTLSLAPNKCLDVTDGVAANGTKIQIWDCGSGNVNQAWSFDNNHWVWKDKYCLDVTDGSTADSTILQIWECGQNNSHQVWLKNAVPAADNSARLAQAANDLNALMPLAVMITNSPVTPMGTYYAAASKQALSKDDQAYLTDPSAQVRGPDLIFTGNLTFNVTLFPNGAPGPQDVQQGAIGDCVMTAFFASLAYLNPGYIASIIQDQGNNTFTVAMYDPTGAKIFVAVDNKFYSGDNKTLWQVGGPNSTANWATIMEKAFMKYNAVYHIKDDNIVGIYSEMVAPAFTGNGNSFFFPGGSLNAQQATTAVKSALMRGMFVTGGFNQVKVVGPDETVVGHGFTDFWPIDGNTIVSARNPWGASQSSNGGPYNVANNGVINIPMSDDFARTMDLRIIEPGAASGPGRTTPYVIPKILPSKALMQDFEVLEPHGRRMQQQRSQVSTP